MSEEIHQGAGARDFTLLTADIVQAYVSNNPVPAAELGSLIQSVHGALTGIRSGVQASAKAAEPLTPAVPIKKSVTPDYIICLDDGKQFKSLRRHLSQTLGISPEQYRAKWGLPHDYPMVAPNYAAQRSALAKSIGLGRPGRLKTDAASQAEASSDAAPKATGTKATETAEAANDTAASGGKTRARGKATSGEAKAPRSRKKTAEAAAA